MLGQSTMGEAGLHARDYLKVLRYRWGLVMVCFLMVFISAVVVTYLTPQEFRGRVVVEISRPAPHGEDASLVPASVRYIENQFKIISSKEVLGRVIDDLGLVGRWEVEGDLAAYRKLSAMVETDEEHGTDMITIDVLAPDPVEAAELANAVAETYEERRRELFRGRLAEVEGTLAGQELAQEEKLSAAHRRFVEVAEKLGISNIDPSFFARFGTADDTGGLQGVLEKMQAEVFAAEAGLRQAESKVQAVEGLEGDRLIRMAVPMGLEDPSLAGRYEQFKSLQLEQIDLRQSGVGKGHPKWLANEDKLATVRGFLLDAARELKEGLGQSLEIARLQHLRLEQMYARLQEESLGARKLNQEFVGAARDYQIQLATLRDLKLTLEQQRIDGAVDPMVVQIHEYAEPDNLAVTPKVRLNLVIGAAAGLLLGVALAFFLEYLDTSVRGVDELEDCLGAQVLAVVPENVAPLHQVGAAHPDAEAYRILRTNIEFASGGADGNAIAFVSAAAAEGKSTTVMNFATVCAQAGYNVLVIDGDLRRPRMHQMFGIRNSVGLTNYLCSDIALEDVVLRTPLENLFFIPSGVVPSDTVGLLNSRRFSELLVEVKARFDLILIDSPPILGVSDASVLASEADSVVVVVQHGKLPRQILAKARSAADKVGAKLLGAVLNNVDLRSDSSYQYYTSYYTYYSESDGAGRQRQEEGKREREEVF